MQWHGVHELIRQARAGGQQALARLYALAQPYLLHLAEKLLGPGWPHKSVSDLIQDTWLRALKGLAGFEGADNDADTGALFRAWLGRTMKNVRLNDLRFEEAQRRKQPPGMVRVGPAATDSAAGSGPGTDPPGRDPTPSTDLCREEQRRRIQQALASLSDPLDLEIIRLHFFEGLSLTCIARQLDISLDRARKGFHRSLSRLKPKLDALQ